jgi:hypothetical protein
MYQALDYYGFGLHRLYLSFTCQWNRRPEDLKVILKRRGGWLRWSCGLVGCSRTTYGFEQPKTSQAQLDSVTDMYCEPGSGPSPCRDYAAAVVGIE